MDAPQIHREEIEEILTTEEILEEDEEVKGSDVREDTGGLKMESGEKAENTSELTTPKFTVTSHTINNTGGNDKFFLGQISAD